MLHERCCGRDIHKKFVVACLLRPSAEGSVDKEIRTFSTMTTELLALGDWLGAEGRTHVVMESTAWRPIYNLLEGHFELLVVNAAHVKAVPGRKTDVRDAEWLAELLRHGLVRGSFLPSPTQRQLRDLTRYRIHLIDERARLTTRVHVVLEDANIKLASVVTDVRGVSARAILQALRGGQTDPQALAELARGRLRSNRDLLAQAVVGRLTPHQAFLLSEQLAHLDDLEEAIARVSGEIDRRWAAEREPLALLDTIPGVSQRTAEALLAELGADLSRFPSAQHLASWAGMCPAHAESGGKRLSGKTRKGNAWLRRTLVAVAHVAAKTKETSLAAQYRRIAARRGKKRALIAVGHRVLVMIYHILTTRTPYRELGGTYFDARERDRVQPRLVHRLERLGFAVTLAPTPTPS